MRGTLVLSFFLITVLPITAQKAEMRALDPFHMIFVSDQIVATISPSSKSFVNIHGSPKIWNEDIKTKVEKGFLYIKTKANFADTVVYCDVFCVEEITQLSMSSGGVIKTDSNTNIKTRRLVIDASLFGLANIDVDVDTLFILAGQGSDVFIRGRAGTVIIDASAGSKIHMETVDCNEASVKAWLGAKIWLTANINYTARVASGAKIYYRKEPVVKFDRKRSTGGNIELEY